MKQPGPAEALKQVLFRLQAVEAELQHQQAPLPPAQEVQTSQSSTEQLLTSVPTPAPFRCLDTPDGEGVLSYVCVFMLQKAEPGPSPDGLSLQR